MFVLYRVMNYEEILLGAKSDEYWIKYFNENFLYATPHALLAYLEAFDAIQ